MAIQMRRGQLANYDKSKMLPGEWGISIDNDSDNQKAFISFAPGVSKEVMMVEDAEEQIAVATAEAIDMATEEAEAWAHGNSFHVNDYASGDGSTKSFTLAETPSSIIGVYVDGSSVSAYTLSGKTITFTTAPASGSNNIRVYYTVNTTTDNAKYYKEQTEAVAESIPEDYSELSEDVDQLKNALKATEIVDTASGAIASFADGSDGLPVKGLTVQMEPIQAGSGDPSPANIRPISGRDSVTVTRTGVNIWDEEWESGYCMSSSGEVAPLSNSFVSKNYIYCFPSTSYYFKNTNNVCFYDESKNFIKRVFIGTDVETTPSNAHYMKFDKRDSSTYNHDISINYPSTDHDYHAGHVQTVEPPLGQTVYSGTLDVTHGVLTVDAEINQYMGNEDWYLSSNYRFYIQGQEEIIRCDQYRILETKVDYASEIPSGAIGQAIGGTVYISDERFNSANEWKAHLSDLYNSGTPLTVIRKLATPITVQLTAQQMTTLLGQNNVWSDAASVSVDYVADTKLYIAKVIADALS